MGLYFWCAQFKNDEIEGYGTLDHLRWRPNMTSLRVTICTYLLKIWSVHIFDWEMKPSHMAGLFEYLFMFWLHRYLQAKQALNSKLTAKWLGFISLSNIWTDHIFIFSSYLVLKWQVVHQKYRPNVMWKCAILLDYLIRLITSNNVIIDND